jgi:O-acetyl-ADP-ribose deacetylase (regulator of RNase III)
MKNLSIEVKTGDITEQYVDLLVNSSNTFLTLGSGTAKQIREAGGYLSPDDKEYWNLVEKADSTFRKVLDYVHSQRSVPSIVQKECLEYIIKKNNTKELSLGDSILTSTGNLSKVPNKAKYVAHAIGMTYDWKVQPNPPIIPATFESVRDSLTKSFDIANELKCKSLALPPMCTRKGGLTKEESSRATLEALERLSDDTTISKVIIVLYSEELEKERNWFERFYKL